MPSEESQNQQRKPEDLEQDTSWVRAKVREANIDKVLDNQN